MIYFVRHGETDYNIKGMIQGQLDIPLNSTGIKQAEELSSLLKNYKIDIIYSSPLSRAKQTAEIINKYHNVKIVYIDNLKEFFAGDKQGSIMREWSKEEVEDFMLHPENYGAESNYDFHNRCIKAFNELSKHKNILIVSHGGVYKHIYRYLNNIEDITAKVELPSNCSIIKLM